MKLLTVVGARPQFVKAAVLSRAIKGHDDIQDIIVHTGQHFDKNMSDVFFDEMEIPKPNYFLDINGLNHGAMTGRMLEEIEKLLLVEKPDYLIVYGDTNSTLAAVLAAKKLHIRTIHVEAGVRNYDDTMPEEVNRYLVDRMAELNFCCTSVGMDNLISEGFGKPEMKREMYNFGDVMYDAAKFYEKKSDENSDIVAAQGLTGKSYTLCTVHRAGNTDNQEILSGIISALNTINETSPVILPLHPRTKAKIEAFGLNPTFRIIDPVGYLDMIQLIKNASNVITDSGGLVREAYFFKKPSVLLLEKKLWPELSDANYSVNIPPDGKQLIDAFNNIGQLNKDFSTSIFGDGTAGEKILSKIIEHYNRSISGS